MPFLQGRLTYTRFRVPGTPPDFFGPEHLAKLEDAMIGKQRVATGDGSQFGWIAGEHILDSTFDLAKNVINDALHFAMRVDEIKMPADMLRAYYAADLAALAASNPSGHPSAKQKREARLSAKDRLEQEASDGRYIRRKMVPVLWDRQMETIYLGTSSASATDRFLSLFKSTFGQMPGFLGASEVAFGYGEHNKLTRMVDDAMPTAFTKGQSDDIAWMGDEKHRGFLGNEFLVWLWFTVENVSDCIKLEDDSEVAVMLARSLTLECPRGQFGSDTFRSDGPAKLPEAMRALRGGRLPRKAGLTLMRHDHAYEFTLQAETLAISSAKLPIPEAKEDRARLEERIDQIRHFAETVTLLYGRFLRVRLGADWEAERKRIFEWLAGVGV